MAIIRGNANGTKSPPTLEPELNKPVARARSRLGNHSAVVLMAAGKLPPSPSPNRIRQIKKPMIALPNRLPISGEHAVEKHRTVGFTESPNIQGNASYAL